MAAREGKEIDFSQIKNKQRRSSLYQKEKLKKAKEKRDRKRKRKQEESQEEGEPKPKQVPRTIDNTRVADETIVEPQDEEVLNDEETDEFAAYFRCKVVPKVLITSSDRSKVKTVQFMKELQHIIPNSEVRVRKGIDLKKIIPQAKEKGFTALVVVNEDKKMPNGVVISHLPDGPTAHFKLTSVKLGRTIKNHGRKTSHRPEVILNNFSTRLGHSVARLLAALFPYDPQFQGRQCVTFHNQRDFIFFRHHSNRSHVMLKCGKNKKVAYEAETNIFLRTKRRQGFKNWAPDLHLSSALYNEELLIPSLENMNGFIREKRWIQAAKSSSFDLTRLPGVI